VLGIALAISVVTDVRERLIYNVVTLPAMVLALAVRGLMAGFRVENGLLSGLVGLAAGGLVFYVMFLFGGMGGGDVKLMAAVGAALGFPVVLYAVAFTALVGGLLAVLVMLWEGSLVETFANMGKKLAHALRIKRIEGEPPPPKYIPYGVAIAIGSVWAVAWDLTHPLM
jgi:prepilin peptidase CpaA